MKDKILGTIFSLSGASLAIGATGFLSGIVTIFINVNEQISVKWLLFTVLTAVSIILILFKVIHDLSQESKPPSSFENPIKFLDDELIFIIKRNENFVNSIIVGCYFQQDEIDRLAYLAVVHLIQEKVIQIRVIKDFSILKEIPTTQVELKNIFIRPVVPVTAIDQLNT
jgi:hypothetical protein